MCAAVEMRFSSTFSAAAGATELLWGWKVAQKLTLLVLSNIASEALAAEDMCWLWGLRTV